MKERIIDAILFIGGTFITVISLSSGCRSTLGGSSYLSTKGGVAFGLTIGICMIVFGF